MEKHTFLTPSGKMFSWSAIVQMMDDDIREDLHGKKGINSRRAFFRAYRKAHWKKYHETFEFAKPNPQV
jgi:hypothetical protein